MKYLRHAPRHEEHAQQIGSEDPYELRCTGISPEATQQSQAAIFKIR